MIENEDELLFFTYLAQCIKAYPQHLEVKLAILDWIVKLAENYEGKSSNKSVISKALNG